MRKRIYEIIEVASGEDLASRIYDTVMMFLIVASLIPLTFKQTNTGFTILEGVTVFVFILDYLVRWATADLKLGKGPASFLIYPCTPMAVIDLLAILPTFTLLSNSLKVLRVLRLLRAVRVFRVFKFFRYSKSFAIISSVVKKQKEPLTAVCVLAVAYILVCALIIFNVEPDTFPTYFHAVYWATVSLTTVGYGDIYPVSMAGQMITMVSSIAGIAIVALPAGIITAGYMDEISKDHEPDSRTENGGETEDANDRWLYTATSGRCGTPASPDDRKDHNKPAKA